MSAGDSPRSGSTSLVENETWFQRRLNLPCGAGRPEYRERHPRLNCALERTGHTDRGPAERPCVHTPKSAMPVVLRRWRVVGRGGGRSNCDSGALRSVRPAIRRLSLRRLPVTSVSALSADCVCRASAFVDAGRDHRDADNAVQAFVKGGADDDVGVLVGLFVGCG